MELKESICFSAGKLNKYLSSQQNITIGLALECTLWLLLFLGVWDWN